MPVSVITPNQQRQDDPLEKLANALNIAKTGFGIVADMKAIEEAKAKRGEEDKLRGLQIKKTEQDLAQGAAEQQGVISAANRATLLKDLQPAKEGEKGAYMIRSMGPDGKPLAEWVRKAPKETTFDPVAAEMKQLRLAEMKNKQGQAGKRDKEFGNRFRNIQTQIANLDKLVEDDGTAELFGDHEKKLQQTIDSIAIDSAKLFDPESVARESEVAAFRNMLFNPGESTTADSTARGALANYKKMIQSRAENEGLAHLVPQDPGGGAGMSAGGGAPPKPKTVIQNGHTYTLNPKTGQYE